MIRIILNGKKAGIPAVRSAIARLREELGYAEVRVTYEGGDVARFVHEAILDGVQRLVIGGGDGSVNEIVDALASHPREKRPSLGILPLGTANDFATACNIPTDPLEALRLAATGNPAAVDIARANERHFVNMATAGFGAQVTAETPVELKNFLGGGAYTLTGVLKAVNFVPYRGRMRAPGIDTEETGIIAAIGNGRQAGGGQVLAPEACINDGLLDVLIVREIPLTDFATLVEEIKHPSHSGRYIRYFKTPWVESETPEPIPVNLDGEPYRGNTIRFEVLPGAIDLVLPEDCPCLL